LTIATTVAMVWASLALGRLRRTSPSGWLHLTHIATGAGTLLAAFSIVLTIIGETGWAFHLSEGILTSAFSAMLMWAAVLLLRALTIVLLNTKGARKLQMVLREGHSICSGCMKIYLCTAVFGWGYFTLKGFGWLAPFTTSLHRLLHWEMEFGDITLTPMNFLYFFFAIWVSLQLSRLLRFILEKDVIPRTSLPQGVPETISKAVHYTTLIVGVFVALSAIGIDGSSLALILGALGFGISFGLQNVVNNFVSGLILLFERPIRVGDKVQIGEMGGVVGEIGIRATTVHTWDGADVIVPNANLISDDIINWTFSDHKRRIEVTVGVAYGVDPETVLALLPSLATAHPEVLADPEPVALFRGFGASSLDFSLRCWTRASAPNIHSDIGISVHRALVDAGIEIPFPQQDLHLKSVDESIRKELFQAADEQRSGEVIASSDE
jgi:small-conductance mechanosensitive channel